MPSVSLVQLEDLLRGIERATAVSFFAETVPDMLLRRNPFLCPQCGRPAVTKCARVNGFLMANYSRAVNRQRGREGRPRTKSGVAFFKALPRTWGDKDPGTPLILYRGKTYLNLKREHVLQVAFRVAGEIVQPGDERFGKIQKWLRPRKNEGSARQHVFKKIVMRDYCLSAIRQITIDKTIYDVRRPRRRKAVAA